MSNGTFHRPADGRVTSWAGPRNLAHGAFNTHYGVDIGAFFGWAVRAAYTGTVVRIYYGPGGLPDGRIIVRHQGFLTSYLHLSAINVRVGQKVRAGHKIGEVGQALQGGPHLHFEVHPGSVWNGRFTASVARANALIRGTRNDASSNPPGRARPASSTASNSPAQKTGGLTVSEAKQIRAEIRELKEEIWRAIRETREIPKKTWEYKDHQNGIFGFEAGKGRQLGTGLERAAAANSHALTAARDASAALAAIEALVENQDKSKEELVAAVKSAAKKGASAVSAADVARQLRIAVDEEEG